MKLHIHSRDFYLTPAIEARVQRQLGRGLQRRVEPRRLIRLHRFAGA